MAEILSLRPYQRETLDALREAWGEGMQRPAVVLPTGVGKTVIFSHLSKEFIEEHRKRVIILVHRDELADQAIEKLRDIAPHLSVGKIKAGENEVHAQVLVCSVQTICRKRRLDQLIDSQSIHGPIGLVVVDECHHAAAKSYKTILSALGCHDNSEFGRKAVGFTATMARGDKVGLGDVWEDVVYSRSILWFISQGYLCDVVSKEIEIENLDLSHVKKSGGDFQPGDLGRALEESELDTLLPSVYKENAGNRPGIVFTPTVATAHGVAGSFNSFGIPSEVISGETSRDDRHKVYSDFKSGKIQVLVNCMVLTEGADFPWAEVAVIARPTKSNSLYIQMVGRVLRPSPGKSSALVLDVVGASQDNKVCTLIDLSPEKVSKIKDGESLLEAAEREEEEKEKAEERPGASPGNAFRLRGREISLFAGSSSSWLRTEAGAWFLPAGKEGYVITWPVPGEKFIVGFVPMEGKWQYLKVEEPKSPNPIPVKMHFEEAKAWAEVEAETRGGSLSLRGARWRKKEPSEGQMTMARRLGAEAPQGATCGEVSDLISVKVASRLIDPYVKNLEI